MLDHFRAVSLALERSITHKVSTGGPGAARTFRWRTECQVTVSALIPSRQVAQIPDDMVDGDKSCSDERYHYHEHDGRSLRALASLLFVEAVVPSA
jgi:hypothetical protein